jgi:phosphopantothenoylcysteine synthetase/decarboxylase
MVCMLSWNRFIEAGGLDSFISDEDEWDSWEKIGDSVLHIELRNIADMLLVCPASADVLAKISNGISDSFFLSILRAWDFNKPCLIAPAMNTLMWRHDITSRHVRYLQSLGCKFIDPVCKKLACEDVGVGALADVTTIVKAVKDYLPASDTEFPTSKIFPIYKSFGNKLSRMKREKMIISRYRVDSFMYGIVVGVVIAGIGGYISSFAKKTVLN